MKKTTKKAMIALKHTWGIGKRKLRSNFERRMWIFESLVKNIILYAGVI